MSDAEAVVRAAWQREQAGDHGEAERLAREGLKHAAEQPDLLLVLGRALRRQGRLAEAIRHLDTAVRRRPAFADAWLERAYLFDGAGSLANAKASYAQACALDQELAPAQAGLASVLEREGERAEARRRAELALALDPLHPMATLTLARIDLAEGRIEAASARLQRLLDRPALPDEERILARHLLGDALSRQGDYLRAFGEYGEAKQLFATTQRAHFAGRPSLVQQIEQTAKVVREVGYARFATSRSSVRQPAFLLGFPRSGTTLVENILATSPQVQALEERPTLRETDRFLDPPERLAELAQASEAELDPYREAYWRRVHAAGVDPQIPLFVDMDPLKGLKLPVIARLFPNAPIVVMRRDPRDVVWSCFRTPFAPSAAAFAFTSLSGAAEVYAALMRFTDTCLTELGLRAYQLKYERLVEDFDEVTGELCGFLGIAWTPALRDFDRTAARRGVTTASQTQVRRGLYDGGGQWRHFADQLAPVKPTLAPFVARYGYPPS